MRALKTVLPLGLLLVVATQRAVSQTTSYADQVNSLQDDARVKAAHAVRVGGRVTVRRHGFVWEAEGIALSDRRGSAADAALLYRESAESVATRELAIAERKAALAAQARFTGRPTKRDRRKLEDFLNEP